MKRKSNNLVFENHTSEDSCIDVKTLLENLSFVPIIKKVKPVKYEIVNKFHKLYEQLQGIYDELSLLSKKSPNDAVNTFKLKFINKLLRDSNSFLNDKYLPFEDFSEFDLDDVPQNSDVVFMLSQYLQCFEKFRADNIIRRRGDWFWAVEAEEGQNGDENGLVYIPTTVPKRLRD